MRAINHALTGAIIGAMVTEPVAALPAAFASHYVLDAIPHHGSKIKSLNNLRTKWFRDLLIVDAALCSLLVLLIFLARPKNWFIIAVCAFLAAAPDFFSYKRYISAVRHKAWKPGLYARFAGGIQWFERPIGGIVEIVWLGSAAFLLWKIIG